MDVTFNLLKAEELEKVSNLFKVTNNTKGIYLDNEFIGILNTQNFRNEAAEVNFNLLAQYDNQENTNKVLNALIDSYDYPNKKEFVNIVDSHDADKINKLTNAGWNYDATLAEDVNDELGGSYIVFTCANPNYGKDKNNSVSKGL